jgi:hypothetical protein
VDVYSAATGSARALLGAKAMTHASPQARVDSRIAPPISHSPDQGTNRRTIPASARSVAPDSSRSIGSMITVFSRSGADDE